VEKSDVKETKNYQQHHDNVLSASAHSVITQTKENIFTPCHFSSNLENLSLVTVGCSLARIGDTLLSQLVLLHCNNAV